jgi:N-acetylmuramic acid 6-phosphate etherase
MVQGSTEARRAASGFDRWPDERILGEIADGQARSVEAVRAAIPALAAAARLAADRLREGGRLVYLGAGTPALIALSDALEIPQTYGIARDRIVTLLAGGADLVSVFAGGVEDEDGAADVTTAGIGPADCVVGISASGSTPYTLSGLKAARAAGAATVAIASNAGAPLFGVADVAVLLDTGPEVIAGSTRMSAGTAQRAALLMLSTLVGTRLGHVYDGMMVNLTADNIKLRKRAAGMVAEIAGVHEAEAAAVLMKTGGAVKPAVLVAAGAGFDLAERLLKESGGDLRAALDELTGASWRTGRP